MKRLAVVASTVTALVLVPAALAAPSPLVLDAHDAPGLRKTRTSVARTARALAQAVAPARLPVTRPARQAAAHFVGPRSELRSAARVYGRPTAAVGELAKLTRVLRKLPIGRVSVGAGGRAVRTKLGVLVVWRRQSAIGLLLLRAPLPQRGLRALALEYARLQDRHLLDELTATAWERSLADTRSNGKLTRRAALNLFAAAYGPVPGLRKPVGLPGGDHDATPAARAILGIWRTLTPRQKEVGRRKLGLRTVTFGRARRGSATDGTADDPDYGDPQFKSNGKLGSIVTQLEKAYEQKLGVLKYPTVVGTSPNAVPPGFDAVTIVVGPNGYAGDAGTHCLIRVAPASVKKPSVVLTWVLAHELFHCYQNQFLTPEIQDKAANWLIEGSADWAAHTIYPVGWGPTTERVSLYLSTCRITPLFERSYDAVGFFGHAAESTGPLWGRIPKIFKVSNALDNGTPYKESGGELDGFLNSWSSSVALRPEFGLSWTMLEPVIPPKDEACPAIPLFAKSSPVLTDAYTLSNYEVDPTAIDPATPIIHFQITKGNARLADGALDLSAVADARFCLTGECKCPPGQEGSPPPAPPLKIPAVLALTGGKTGAAGMVELESLDTYCKEKKDPPAPPGGGPPIGGGGGNGGPGGGCQGRCGTTNGDPHLRTFDGTAYDFQAAGEFTLVRSMRRDLEVQVRQDPFPGSTDVSINTAVALRLGPARVVVSRGTPPEVRVDGERPALTRKALRLRGGGTLRSVGRAQDVEARWPDGSTIRLWSVGPGGIAVVMKPARSRAGKLRGLLGDFDGNGETSDDFRTRAGRKLSEVLVTGRAPGSFRALYRTFGDSWRIRQGGSLFDYAEGQSTRTFTKRRFPIRSFGTQDLSPAVRRRAEAICRRLRITDPGVFQDCILDVGLTGDGRFATSSKQLERTAGKHGLDRIVVETRWAKLSTGGNSNQIAPSLALDRGQVVVASKISTGVAEATTFTPSRELEIEGLRRNLITSGWDILSNPVLLPRAGGGLQVVFDGLNPNRSLNGALLAVRNPNGSFGAPVVATPDSRAEVGGTAVLAPDGQPLWAGAYAGGLRLWRGSTNATGADLSALVHGTDYIPSVGRDGMGRYWVAWYVLGAGTTGAWMAQFDAASLQPIGAARRAPRSQSIWNAGIRLALACAQMCRLVYHEERAPSRTRLSSWSPGERAPTVITQTEARVWVAAAYAGSRLWTVWEDNDRTYHAALGNARGAGGKPIDLGQLASAGSGFGVSAIPSAAGLVVVVNWQPPRGSFTRYVNVVSPPG